MGLDMNAIRSKEWQEIKEVCGRYQNPNILKTDCSNEIGPLASRLIRINEIKGNVTCLEINEKVIENAQKDLFGITIIRGDVRDIPFPEQWFDVLIDLSTIDHIHPYEIQTVFKEYKRVLKPNGTVLMFVWLTGNITYKERQEGQNKNNSEAQYFFQENDFIETLNRYFKVMKTEKIAEESDIYFQMYILKI
mgnify:CR=1 FL=1